MRKHQQQISIQQRQHDWIVSHGDAWQARKADLYYRHGVNDALAVLFSRVCAGR